ncbi:hypothetical protein MY4824_003108 [Beauveria thailandica]
MTTLDYKAYPLGPGQIRLISLAPPPTDGSRRKWKLEVCSLDNERGRYYAISYRWGAPLLEGHFGEMSNDPLSPVPFETGLVNVTQNLSDFLACVEASCPASQTKEDAQDGNLHHGSINKNQVPSLSKAPGRISGLPRTLFSAKFWVDAVCVNQKDADERSHQLSTVMAKIYESATSVIAWLGDSDSHTERAFAHLEALAQGTGLAAFQTISPPSSTVSASSEDILNSHQHWESTAKLFERTYWNRVWIIQEVVLAKQVIVCCGQHSISWGVLSKASHNICTRSGREYFAARQEKLPTLQALDRRRHSSYAIPTLLKAVKDSLKGNHWATILLHSLIRSRDCEATNLEDKVYALLGLVQGSVDVGKMPLLRPEFGGRSRIGKTYLNVAIQLLGDCEDLLVLASVEGKPFQTVDLGDGRPLPSWVPDWSCRLPLGLRVTGLKRYSADACFLLPDMSLSRAEKLARWPAHVNRDENTVAIGAVKVDEIVCCGEPKHEVWTSFPFPRLLSMFLSLPAQYSMTEESGLEAFWRTLIANTAGEERAAPPKDSFMGPGFVKWFKTRVDSITERKHQKDSRWNDLERRFNDYCSDNKEWHHLYTASDAVPLLATCGSAKAEYALTFSHAMFSRPFLTAKGYLGLGSQSMQQGDTVWVVPRSRVPLIFRRAHEATGPTSGDYHCQLVGSAYLHGFMDGRALALMAETEGMRAQDLLQTVVIR